MDDFLERIERGENDDDDDDDDDNGSAGLKGGSKPYVALAILMIVRFF